MNKRHLSLLAAATIALFSACSNIVENAEPQAKLTVLVRNSVDGKSIADATVTLLSSGEIKTTNSEGLASFGSVSGGTHGLRIDANNYASGLYRVDIQQVSQNASSETNAVISLAPLSAKLIGYAYYEEDDKGNKKPASGAKIRITFEDWSGILANPALVTTVGPDGKYEFALPPTSMQLHVQDIRALENKIGNVTYAEGYINLPFDLTADATVKADDFTYSYSDIVNASSFTLLNWTEEELAATAADSTKEIVLNFSDAIDVAKSRNAIDVSLPADIIYSNDNKTVTIKPLGKWAGDFYVDITDLQSVRGKNYDGFLYYSFVMEKPDIINGQVEGLKKGDVNSYYTEVIWNDIWNEIKEDTYYTIYARDSKGNNTFEEYTSQAAEDICSTTGSGATRKTVCSYDIYMPYFSGDGKVVVVVQAFNLFNGNVFSKSTITDVIPLALN
jgi:antitoxin component of RelBE/YafQ-DinJ toxin-antitoxin module